MFILNGIEMTDEEKEDFGTTFPRKKNQVPMGS